MENCELRETPQLRVPIYLSLGSGSCRQSQNLNDHYGRLGSKTIVSEGAQFFEEKNNKFVSVDPVKHKKLPEELTYLQSFLYPPKPPGADLGAEPPWADDGTDRNECNKRQRPTVNEILSEK